MWTGRVRFFGLLLVMSLGAVLYWSAQVPGHAGNWQASHARLAGVASGHDERGQFYHLTNLRDFRYRTDGSIAAADYREARFAVADLRRIWFGISHFGGYGFAHTFLSFEFADEQYLVASVEARMRPDQNYHPLFGLIRQYNKIVVLGTEADIIGLRSHIRGEQVLLYPLQLDAAQTEYLFHALMGDAQQLVERPGFYNTLLDNCTTNLLKHAPGYRFYTSLIDYRLMFPGYSDAVAWEKNWINTDQPLEELRERARINPALTTPEAEDFSQMIRRGWRSP